MATEKQFEHFKYIYTQEEDRYKELISRANIFMAIATFYLGFLATNFLPTVKPSFPIALFEIIKLSLLLLGFSVFIIAFIFIIMSINIYRHEVLADPKEIIENYGDVVPKDEDFFDDRIIEFAASTIKNRTINNNRAIKLKYAAILMLIGITLHVILLFFKISIKK